MSTIVFEVRKVGSDEIMEAASDPDTAAAQGVARAKADRLHGSSGGAEHFKVMKVETTEIYSTATSPAP